MAANIQKQLNHSMTKPTKWQARPAKTQIIMGIHSVWSESSLSAWRKLGSLATQWARSVDSDHCEQTVRMRRPIWVFAGRTGHFVGLSWAGSTAILSAWQVLSYTCQLSPIATCSESLLFWKFGRHKKSLPILPKYAKSHNWGFLPIYDELPPLTHFSLEPYWMFNCQWLEIFQETDFEDSETCLVK